MGYRLCVLSDYEDICCTHRMQLASSQRWQFISQHCRDRVRGPYSLCTMYIIILVIVQIAAVCDLYMYIGHIEKGILKHDGELHMWLCFCMCVASHSAFCHVTLIVCVCI